MTDVFARLESFGDRFRLQRGLAPGKDWIACDRLLDPWSGELKQVLDAERRASGQVSDHATALTVMAVYAGTVTAAAVLAWAVDGVVIDMRPHNVAIRLSPHHGFEGVGLREPTVTDAPVETLVTWVLDDHLLPLAQAMHVRTRAGLRQLYGGVAHGCAAAFCIASRRGGDVDQLESAYQTFLTAATGGLDRLGEVIRLAEGGREGLFYLRNTCCLYYTSAEKVKCSSCCLDTVEDRVANYRRVLADGVVPH
ncbi:(2Fe-2S)-binding protein [Nonomuraea turcica]|uniref:(2Fe-2S)-binding protein n=1 Tax=Nonomuraea sp. G32 TaxID=3067274 RepID=UPI00273C2D33|nr:(2Fe-2S)-binding protein [Nonomuraea sp. G32]MDP4505416.1 (2Fe-2S)-binding protein [Nonomuraea sp. G32]